MAFIKVENDVAIDYTLQQLKRDTGVSFPSDIATRDDLLAEYDVFRVVQGTVPTIDSFTQKIEMATELVDGFWTRVYQAVDLTDEERNTALPKIVSMRQARLALSEAGHLAAVQTAMDAADEATQIEWDYATTVERNSPLVTSMAAVLSLTDAQVDDLFRVASTK